LVNFLGNKKTPFFLNFYFPLHARAQDRKNNKIKRAGRYLENFVDEVKSIAHGLSGQRPPSFATLPLNKTNRRISQQRVIKFRNSVRSDVDIKNGDEGEIDVFLYTVRVVLKMKNEIKEEGRKKKP
jgi:hypothetical protein